MELNMRHPNALKLYAAIRLGSLLLMGTAYADPDMYDDFTNHHQVIVAPQNQKQSFEVEALVQSTLKQADMANIQGDEQADEENRPVRVLSLDGGGIRGVGVAEILSVIEARVKALTGKPLYELFDLIVGTSTGGIIATALGMGLGGTELVDIYKEDANEIFKKRWFGGLYGAKYGSEGLKKVIKKRVGDKKMKDAKTRIAVTTYNDKARRTHLLTNETPKSDSINYDRTALPAGEIDITKTLRTTSAAPSFFQGKEMSDGDFLGDSAHKGKKHKFVDGGVSANNPSQLAKAYAKRLLKDGAFGENHKRKIQIYSIGTGEADALVLERDAGMFGFGNPGNLPGYFMDAAGAEVHGAMKEEMKEGKNYFRLQFKINKAELDDTSPEYIKMLISQAHKATETEYFNQMIQALCGQTVKKVFAAETAIAA
jgi:predicted acylesterase/phospholipase RssA